jgi:hypothetical protein
MEYLNGQIVEVMVSKNGKSDSKDIKVCKVKARSILFIEVDRVNRKNTFWKLDRKNIQSVGPSFGNTGKHAIIIKDGILLSDNKWESDWDAIGNISRMAAGSFAYTPRPTYSNHSKGWASNGAHFRT